MNKALDLLREIRPSIPKEVLELWCKDRDAFLASHSAVEQAVGDERAAFEAAFAAMGRPVCRADYDHAAYGTPFDDGGWTGWQARAALAQPSPAIATAPTYQFHSREIGESDWAPCDFSWYLYCSKSPEMDTRVVEVTAQPSPAQAEQAEAERPEVVAYRTIGRHTKHQHPHYALNYYKQNAEDQAAHWRERGCEVSEDELMTVAQHDRIFGALRADRDSWAEQAEQRLADWDEMRKERDAALVEVERLRESKGDPVGSFEKCMKVMYERDEHAKRLEVALARVAEMEAKLAELEKQEPIGWWAQYCETPMRRMVHWGAKGPECTSEEFHPFYAAPFVKAQHRVPGKYDEVLLPFLKSMEHELHANAGKGDRPGWLQMDRKTALLEIYYHLGKLQKATKGNDTAGIVEYAADVANMSMMLVDVCGLLAAAPGKEVGHE
ncbi:hypothetical protein ACM7HG_30740 [Pseudomonas aeruginosa]